MDAKKTIELKVEELEERIAPSFLINPPGGSLPTFQIDGPCADMTESHRVAVGHGAVGEQACP